VTSPKKLTPLEAEDSIDTLYGCLKALQRDPLADLEAEHHAEISADPHSDSGQPL